MHNMQVQTQFSVFLVNKPGVLAGVTTALAKAKVNLVALTLTDSVEQGVLRIVTDDVASTRDVLSRTHDRWTETDVLTLELQNRPGAFATVTERLASQHINISYAYCTGGAKGGRTTAVFKVADLKKAQKVLAERLATTDKNRTVRKAPRRSK